MDKYDVQTQEDAIKKEKETEIVKRALLSTYKDLNEKALRQATRETIFAPQDIRIKIGGRNVSASDLRYEVANTIENLGSDKSIEHAQDLQSMIAQSIENINSETSSSQEYFRWLDETTDILKNMNDGFVTDEDLEKRNEFLDFSHQREAELLVCLGLYQSSKNPEAQEKAKQIRYKLTKLREMRSAIENRTRNQADVEISRTEYEAAIPYYKLYRGLAKLPFGYDIARQQKINLGINHDDDDDLDEDYNYYDNLLNVVLDQMEEEDLNYIAREYQLAHDMAREPDTFAGNSAPDAQEIADKLQELSGRKNTFRVKYDIVNARLNEKRNETEMEY